MVSRCEEYCNAALLFPSIYGPFGARKLVRALPTNAKPYICSSSLLSPSQRPARPFRLPWPLAVCIRLRFLFRHVCSG